MTNNKTTDKIKNNTTEVTIGSTKYISLCKNCQFSKDIRFIQPPKTNSDIKTNFPSLDQHYCPTVHTDLVYLKYGKDEVLLDVAECSSYKPLNKPTEEQKKEPAGQSEITGESIRKKKQSSKHKHND